MTDEEIIALVKAGHHPDDVAAHMIDKAVAGGQYEGCSSELEIAYGEYQARIEQVLRDPLNGMCGWYGQRRGLPCDRCDAARKEDNS